MKRAALVLAVLALYVLHQDVWSWRQARPLALGFLPVGLWYHACFCLAAAGVMWLLVAWAWPAHLEEYAERAHAEADTAADVDVEMPTR